MKKGIIETIISKRAKQIERIMTRSLKKQLEKKGIDSTGISLKFKKA